MFNPFALPVHPALVHFPVATLTIAWLCVLLRYLTGDVGWDGRARLFEIVGVAVLPFTIVAGFVDTRGFRFVLHPQFDGPLIWHMLAGLATAAAFGSHLWWRWSRPAEKLHGASALIDVGLVTLGFATVVGGALIAAEMVYGA